MFQSNHADKEACVTESASLRGAIVLIFYELWTYLKVWPRAVLGKFISV